MHSPIISVYITNFNYESFIEKSIESAINQTFDKKKFEIIIIDDNSTDESKKIIKKFINKRNVRIIFNKKNIGLIKTINIAIKAAKGEYIIRLDSDDMLHKNALKELYKVAKKDKNIGIVYSDFFIVDNLDNILKEKKN